MEANMKRIWDNFEEIAEVRKSDGIKFVIAAATREGFRYINIREFYMRKRDGVWMPGRDGITIPLKAPLQKGKQFIKPYVDLVEALAKQWRRHLQWNLWTRARLYGLRRK